MAAPVVLRAVRSAATDHAETYQAIITKENNMSAHALVTLNEPG